MLGEKTLQFAVTNKKDKFSNIMQYYLNFYTICCDIIYIQQYRFMTQLIESVLACVSFGHWTMVCIIEIVKQSFCFDWNTNLGYVFSRKKMWQLWSIPKKEEKLFKNHRQYRLSTLNVSRWTFLVGNLAIEKTLRHFAKNKRKTKRWNAFEWMQYKTRFVIFYLTAK